MVSPQQLPQNNPAPHEELHEVRRELTERIDNKVPIWVFTTVFLALLAIFGGVAGWLASKTFDIQSRLDKLEQKFEDSQNKPLQIPK